MKQRNLRSFSQPEVKPERRLSMMLSFAIKAIIPVLAFFSSLILIDEGQKAKWLFLSGLKEPIHVPIYWLQMPVFGDLFFYLSHLDHLKAIVLFFIAFWLVYAAIFMVMYAILMKIFGPSYYGKYDVPGSSSKQK